MGMLLIPRDYQSKVELQASHDVISPLAHAHAGKSVLLLCACRCPDCPALRPSLVMNRYVVLVLNISRLLPIIVLTSISSSGDLGGEDAVINTCPVVWVW